MKVALVACANLALVASSVDNHWNEVSGFYMNIFRHFSLSLMESIHRKKLVSMREAVNSFPFSMRLCKRSSSKNDRLQVSVLQE